MRMASIASGSSGNCIYIGSERTHILVDAGISNKRIVQGLHDIGLKEEDVSAILITHEHSDHVQGLRVFTKKCHLPIYATQKTFQALEEKGLLVNCDPELLRVVRPDERFSIEDMTVEPFSIDHDAADPVAYRVGCAEKSVAVATDMGHYDSYITDHLQGLDAVLLESNHDVRMLESGPYPYQLKQRILGDHGHLSNESAGRLLSEILHDHIQKIFLGHLSRENNYEALAYETVRQEIDDSDTPYGAADFSISIAGRDRMSEIVEL